jgi:predicted nucleic acid-binding protein
MILLDTNVVSELLKPTPETRVVQWLNEQATSTLQLPAVVLAELLAGVEIMPAGRRKEAMMTAMRTLVNTLTATRILSFDRAAAEAYFLLTSRARANGFMVGFADGQIGAIAMVHGLSVATRDVAPFLAMGVRVINPWEES